MPKAQQLLNGTLSGYPPPTFSLMKEALAKAWPLISKRYQSIEATARGRLSLASAIVAVTPSNASEADAIVRMAIDLVNIEERDLKPTENLGTV
jgi:hypothetical protein